MGARYLSALLLCPPIGKIAHIVEAKKATISEYGGKQRRIQVDLTLF
jgi:hypothetical protein